MTLGLANTQIILIIALLVLVLLVLYVFSGSGRRRSEALKERFGPEYDRAVATLGDRKAAETELLERTKRVKALEIQPLTERERAQFLEQWRKTQAEFVDDPSAAVKNADHLVNQVMETRGYPMGDFENRAAVVSVDHAGVVQNYRKAHDIATRNDRGQASTEDLRQAMVYYRSLFNDLLETGDTEPPSDSRIDAETM